MGPNREEASHLLWGKKKKGDPESDVGEEVTASRGLLEKNILPLLSRGEGGENGKNGA